MLHFTVPLRHRLLPSYCEALPGPLARQTQEDNAPISDSASLIQLLTQLPPWVWQLEALRPSQYHTPSLAHPVSLLVVLGLRVQRLEPTGQETLLPCHVLPTCPSAGSWPATQ